MVVLGVAVQAVEGLEVVAEVGEEKVEVARAEELLAAVAEAEEGFLGGGSAVYKVAAAKVVASMVVVAVAVAAMAVAGLGAEGSAVVGPVAMGLGGVLGVGVAPQGLQLEHLAEQRVAG